MGFLLIRNLLIGYGGSTHPALLIPRKKFRSALERCFPATVEPSAFPLTSKEEQVTQAKVVCHGGEVIQVSCSSRVDVAYWNFGVLKKATMEMFSGVLDQRRPHSIRVHVEMVLDNLRRLESPDCRTFRADLGSCLPEAG